MWIRAHKICAIAATHINKCINSSSENGGYEKVVSLYKQC